LFIVGRRVGDFHKCHRRTLENRGQAYQRSLRRFRISNRRVRFPVVAKHRHNAIIRRDGEHLAHALFFQQGDHVVQFRIRQRRIQVVYASLSGFTFNRAQPQKTPLLRQREQPHVLTVVVFDQAKRFQLFKFVIGNRMPEQAVIEGSNTPAVNFLHARFRPLDDGIAVVQHENLMARNRRTTKNATHRSTKYDAAALSIISFVSMGGLFKYVAMSSNWLMMSRGCTARSLRSLSMYHSLSRYASACSSYLIFFDWHTRLKISRNCS